MEYNRYQGTFKFQQKGWTKKQEFEGEILLHVIQRKVILSYVHLPSPFSTSLNQMDELTPRSFLISLYIRFDREITIVASWIFHALQTKSGRGRAS